MLSNHEVIIPNEDLPFKMFLFEGEHGNYFRDKHWHRSIEIFAVFEGHLTFYLNDKEQRLDAGEFVLVNSNEIHAVDAPVSNKTIVLQIPLQEFSEYFTGNQYIRFTHERSELDQEIMELVQNMYESYCKKEVGYDMRVKSRYYMLLYMLISMYRELEVKEEWIQLNKKLSKLTPITRYIKEHYQEEISLESLAEIFGYAPTYISRMFQKYAGINYKDYLQNIRIEYAFADLKRAEMTVSEIAYKNGFPNSRALTNAFRKKYRMVPSEYLRKKNQVKDL